MTSETTSEDGIEDIPVEAEETVAHEPVTEETVADETMAEEPTTEEPVVKEPMEEEPVADERVAEEALADESVAEEAVIDEPVAEEPTTEEPVIEEPEVEEPMDEEPVADERVAEEALADEPVAEEAVIDEPVAEEPTTQEPLLEEPVADEQDEQETPTSTPEPPLTEEQTEADGPDGVESPDVKVPLRQLCFADAPCPDLEESYTPRWQTLTFSRLPKVKGPDEYLEEVDKDGNGGISEEEMALLLGGILPKDFTSDEKRFTDFVQHEFYAADLDQDGLLNRDEFYLYFYSRLCFDLPPDMELPDGSHTNPGEALFKIYTAYCSYGHFTWTDEMGSNTFLKLCKECGLLDKASTMKQDTKLLTRQNLELIFTRVRVERFSKRELKANKIDFGQFLEALTRAAQRKRVGISKIIDKILAKGPPRAQESLGFLSGIDLNMPISPNSFGGRNNTDGLYMSMRDAHQLAVPGRSWLTGTGEAEFLDWAPTSNRGRYVRDELREAGVWETMRSHEGLGECMSPLRSTFSPGKKAARGAVQREETTEWWTAVNMSWEEMLPQIKEIFMKYNRNQCPPTLHDMESSTWVSLLQDAHLVGRNDQGEIRADRARMIFGQVQGGRVKKLGPMPGGKVKVPGKNSVLKTSKSTISVNQFIKCLRKVAADRRMSFNRVCEKILIAGAPPATAG